MILKLEFIFSVNFNLFNGLILGFNLGQIWQPSPRQSSPEQVGHFHFHLFRH